MSAPPKRPADSATEMVQVVLPNDANPLGRELLPGAAGQVVAVVGAVVATAVVGLAFSWLRERADSLVAPMLVHVATNSTGALLAYLVQR